MPILDIQYRRRELGRIRPGIKVPSRDGTKEYPKALETLRLTSPEKRYIDLAAEIFGGKVESWRSPRGEEWEVITGTAELPVLVPKQDLVNSQYYELWGKPEGGKGVTRLRRCDGNYESLSGKKCMCDPDNRDCKPTTHLVVMIRQLPDIGVWRVTSHGFNAAAELPASVHTLGTMMAFGAQVDALLVTAPRSSTDEKGQKHNFRVIELRIPHTAEDLLAALPADVNRGDFVAALTAGPQAAVPVGRPILPPPSEAVALPAAPEAMATPNVIVEPPDGETSEPVEISEVAELADGFMMEDDQPLDESLLSVKERVELEVAKLRDPAEQEARLVELLTAVPDPEARENTMKVWEHYIRTVFSIMEKLGHWKGQALHAVLRSNFQAQHLSDLNKAQLVALGQRLAQRASTTVGHE